MAYMYNGKDWLTKQIYFHFYFYYYTNTKGAAFAFRLQPLTEISDE